MIDLGDVELTHQVSRRQKVNDENSVGAAAAIFDYDAASISDWNRT
jgi:hypothetical protein